MKTCGDGVQAFLRFCEDDGRETELSRLNLREFVDHLLTGGAKSSTTVSRHFAVRRFSAWLWEEGEQSMDPLAGMRPPSSTSLMAVAGWARPDMLLRYTRARAADRALEAQTLDLGKQ